MKDILSTQKIEQVARLAGKDVDNGAGYDPDEPMPERLAIRPPTVEGGSAGPMLVNPILAEINSLPTVRDHQVPLKASHLPPFSAKLLEEYKADYKSWKEWEIASKSDLDKYPLRKGLLEALAMLKEQEKTNKLVMEERLYSPGGASFDGKAKAAFLQKQKDPGILIFEMQNVVDTLKAAADEREKETSKRWLANFDYSLARVQARLIYVYEYNYLLGQIRADNLPALEPIHNGWRLGARPKVQVPEPKVKEMVKGLNRTWKRIAEEYPGTPWAILATRENLTALGLEWRPTRD